MKNLEISNICRISILRCQNANVANEIKENAINQKHTIMSHKIKELETQGYTVAKKHHNTVRMSKGNEVVIILLLENRIIIDKYSF